MEPLAWYTSWGMSSDQSPLDSARPLAELAAFALASAAAVGLELAAHPEYRESARAILAYRFDPQTTPPALALLAAPLVWWLGRRGRPGGSSLPRGVATTASAATPPGEPAAPVDWKPELSDAPQSAPSSNLHSQISDWQGCRLAWCLSLALFAISVGLTAAVGTVFRGMPPAFHDEYSYLFQAKTFLAGRLFFPAHRLAEFFDQMHVLNDRGVFASRYFPGVGLWLAPWVAWGHPHWGQYLAGGLVVVCVFWIGRKLAQSLDRPAGPSDSGAGANTIGFLAGLFVALSPAMLVFGNLLLSHHPTMLGLAAFACCYLQATSSDRLGWPILGGIGLAFAMLCRPLTAFGFALPFAMHLAWLVYRRRVERPALRVLAGLAPVAVGALLLAGYNAALTGSALETPYGLYTRIYTPNHVYGFHNVSRGQAQPSPKTLANYNAWAEELTLPRALGLVGARSVASARWSLGVVAVAWFTGLLLVALWWLPPLFRLVAAAVAGLHAVYFPFGFEGIFGVSYVFETVPLVCLLAAGACGWLARGWRDEGRVLRTAWLAALLASALPAIKDHVAQAIGELDFARSYYAAFEQRLKQAGVRAPAIVFIEPDPVDRHRDLVTNSPSLDDPILRARNLGARNLDLARAYPDRALWLYDVRSRQLIRLRSATP